jgi:hypothetical protein
LLDIRVIACGLLAVPRLAVVVRTVIRIDIKEAAAVVKVFMSSKTAATEALKAVAVEGTPAIKTSNAANVTAGAVHRLR